MGKRSKTFKGKNAKSRGGDPGQGVRGNYDNVPTENAGYEKYYREASIIPDDEWPVFWETLKKTLPTTFRFTGSKAHAIDTMKTLKNVHIPHLEGVEWDGELVDAPKPLPWYPDGLAWTTTVGKSTIRRCPPFKKFQSFLVNETTVGNISRQEAVSMIPPLLMDVKPHHKVLDMCAAPGSKTAQLIEALHMGEEVAVGAATSTPGPENLGSEGNGGGRSTGLVIANDSDYRRSHMLIHQTKRLNSPNLLVTNHDATMFPSISTSKAGEYLKFDRILADVPCTGDGTTRKNYGVWRDWTPMGALNLHMIQQRILIRGLQMLKVGGRIVYSTCSMNPIENEAVVAAAIDRCGGLDKVRIVDCSDRLPELKRRAGLKGGWRVMDKDLVWYSSWDEVIADTPGREARMSRLVKTMFPTEDGKDDADPTRIPLERGLRVYPHLQDTGGFFITVLEKKEEIRQIKEEYNSRRRMAAIAARQRQAVATPESTDHSGEAPVEGSVSATPEATAAESSVSAVRENAAPSTVEPDEEATLEATATETPDTPAADPVAPSSPTKRKLESPAPAETPAMKKAKQDGPAPKPSNGAAKKKGGPPPEEPFKYLPHDHAVLQQIYAFYDLDARFPRNCFMVRNADALPSRAIYFTSQLARGILETNEGKGVRFVHCGVKAFMKQDVQSPEVCPWRLQNEGLTIVAPWIGETRVVRAYKKETVHGLLKELFPKVNEEGIKGEAITEIEDRCRELGMGCCVLKAQKGPGEDEFDDDMVLPLWKSRHSCNLMLPKDERRAMLMRLYNDESEPIDSTKRNSHQHRDATTLQSSHVEAAADGEGGDDGVAGHLVDSKDGVSRLEDPDPMAMEGIEGIKSEGDVEPVTLQPVAVGPDGATMPPAGADPPSTKIPTEDEIKKEVDEMMAQKTEADIKDAVMGGADL